MAVSDPLADSAVDTRLDSESKGNRNHWERLFGPDSISETLEEARKRFTEAGPDQQLLTDHTSQMLLGFYDPGSRSRLWKDPDLALESNTFTRWSEERDYDTRVKFYAAGGAMRLPIAISLSENDLGAKNQSSASVATDIGVKTEFHLLSRKWKLERNPTSSMAKQVAHPAYQMIIGMGKDVLPYILSELADENDHWYWALKAITREDPVPQELRGNMSEMRDAWLRWGRENLDQERPD